MSHEPRTVVRDFRPEDRGSAIEALTASFLGFGPLDQVVGDDDKAQDRRRRMYEMALKEGTKQNVIVAERDGGIEGVLTYADRPDCIPSTRDSDLRTCGSAGRTANARSPLPVGTSRSG